MHIIYQPTHELAAYSCPITLLMKCHQLITRPLTPREMCTTASDACAN